MERKIREKTFIISFAVMVLIAVSVMAGEAAFASSWPSYRGNDCNNGIISAGTPTEQKATEPVWIKKFGESSGGMANWDNAPTVPIIVDDDVITTSGTSILRLSGDNGKKLDSGTMTDAADWGYTPLTYVEAERIGLVFCPLANGTIDVFDVDVLEKGPLWTFCADKKDAFGNSKWGLTPEMTLEEYKATHKGEEPPAELITSDGNVLAPNSKHQSLSPVVYSDGMIYTGFFTYPHTYYDYYVAIAAEDMTITDPVTGEEKKYRTGDLVWKYKSKGGFYWNGAVVVGDAVIVGTQDGADESTPGDSKIIAFNKKTGEIISEYTLEEAGDICSSIVYDKDGTGRLYWTASAGCLCSAAVDPETGELSDAKQAWLARPSKDPSTKSTPVVHKNRVYIGYKEKGVNGYFAAFDAASLANLFKAELPSYSKSSPLITYAYEESTKYLYAYMASYDIPGDIIVIKFKNNATNAYNEDEVKVSQLFAANGYEEYGACSVIADGYGQLYYKNDSQSIFAIGKCKELNLGKPVNLKVKTSGTKVTVTYSKTKNATSYRLLYRLNESGKYKRVNLTKLKYTKKFSKPTVFSVKVRPEHVDAAKTVYGTYNPVVTVYAAKSKIKKLSGGKGSFTVQFDRHKIADGYQIQYSTKKNMKYGATISRKGYSKTKQTISGIVGGTTYYVRVRSYKVVGGTKQNGKWVGGTTLYGSWSSKKKVKVKSATTYSTSGTTGSSTASRYTYTD